MVGDTKITRGGDEAWTRKVFRNALPKTVILRDDLAVGLAGEDPAGMLQRLVGLHGETVERVLDSVANISAASFVVATLSPVPRLWAVSDGSVEDRSAIDRAWAGDHDAYELFQQRYHEWPSDVESAFRLMSSMQWLLTFDPVDSVGGYLTRIATGSDGFRLVGDSTQVAPWLLEGVVQALSDEIQLTLRVPAGGDGTWYRILPAVGRPPTIRALAYYVPQAGVAWLFPHESPWAPVPLRVNSVEDLLKSAAEHGQALVAPAPW